MSSPGVRCDWQTDKKEVKERAKHLLENEQWSDCSFIVGTEPNQKVMFTNFNTPNYYFDKMITQLSFKYFIGFQCSQIIFGHVKSSFRSNVLRWYGGKK